MWDELFVPDETEECANLIDVQRDAEILKQYSVLKEQRCCGNCHWFDNEDVYGVGWCSNNERESSCDQVCCEYEF